MAEATVTQTTGAAPVVPAATQAAAAPAPGTPAHDAAMAAKFDATQAAPAADPNARPAGLPEKFKSWEDMAKSYAELEKKLGAPQTPAAPAKTDTPAPTDAKPADSKLAITPEQKAAEGAVQKAGLDMTALSAEFAENGDLKPETYTKLADSGIPKEMVDSYIAGQKAIAVQYEAEAFTTAGGEENYTKMTAWAKTGMQPEEQQAFNKAVTSGDKAQMKLAVAGLKARFEANFGSQPNLVQGQAAPAGDVYESFAQVTADMKKPEYKKDPAFRAKVEAKLGRSNNIGRIVERAM